MPRCTIAASLAGDTSSPLAAPVKPKQCQACVACPDPSQANYVTASLAIHWVLGRQKQGEISESVARESHMRLNSLLRRNEHPDGTPGTELAAMIKQIRRLWSGVGGGSNADADDDCSECLVHMAEMNAWGPAGCRERIDTIVVWLRESAIKRGIAMIFAKWSFRKLVEMAIVRAERRAVQSRTTDRR